jgi:two-component system cell cycle sensor histidine kinase/response regulator CckA
VLEAIDADDALRTAERHPATIDLLLTDVVMPGGSGKDLATAMATLTTETSLLFLSGYSQAGSVHQGVLEEGFQLIEKPFEAKKLLRKVREVLDR